MSSYSVKNRVALVTGGGSGIGHTLTKLLLASECSVVIGDLQLGSEAEATAAEYPHPAPEPNKPSVFFHKTDIADWSQISSLWKTAVETFGRVDIVVNCAGVYEPPWSSFWKPPGISSVSADSEDAQVGQYKTFAINTTGPIRLAQIAVDYWQQHPEIEGNILFIASIGAYLHSMMTPFYFASKGAIISMVKSLSGLRDALGIRISAICPGPTFTPIFHPEYARDRLQSGDVGLEARQVAELMMRMLQEPQYGNGNITEILMTEDGSGKSVSVRDVEMEALYPTYNPMGPESNMLAEEMKLRAQVKEKGMRG